MDGPAPIRRKSLRRGQRVWVAHGGRIAEPATVAGRGPTPDSVRLVYDEDRRPGRVWGAWRAQVFFCEADALNWTPG